MSPIILSGRKNKIQTLVLSLVVHQLLVVLRKKVPQSLSLDDLVSRPDFGGQVFPDE